MPPAWRTARDNMPSLHSNRRLWQKHVLAENRRSIDGLLSTLSAEPVYQVMATGETYRGREAVAGFYRAFFDAVPDAAFELVDAFVAENGVVEESVLIGTPRGQIFGLRAEGQPVRLPLIIVFPMADGEILGERLYFDLADLRRQLAPGA